MSGRSTIVTGVMAAGALMGPVAAQQCSPGWEAISDGPSNITSALAVYDEASQPSLFVGGWFQSAGGTPTGSVARWDGSKWSAVGNLALDPITFAMIEYDDGSGSALYIGASTQPAPISSAVVRWTGVQGSTPGDGLIGYVLCFAVHLGELYAGGDFWFPAYGEHGPRNVARWTGQSWQPVGGGTDRWLNSMVSFDDGRGPSLFVTGHMPSTPARWDGTQWAESRGRWQSVGGRFVLFDDGTGEALYIVGHGTIDSVVTRGLLRWDGGDWDFTAVVDSVAHAAAVWDDGVGHALYLGGDFENVNGIPAHNFARWDGDHWTGTSAQILGQTVVHDFAGFEDGAGPALYAVGSFGGRYLARYRTCNHIEPCYANCDGSTTEPILTVDDFTCFINAFAEAQGLPPQQQIEHYANCDGSTTEPILTVDDFTCFINAFAQGCP